MTELATRLIRLLDGDFVRLETEEFEINAEVVTHERERYEDPNDGELWRHTIRFMPVGESATDVEADRFCVTVESDDRDEWAIGELHAEIFVETELSYEQTPQGELTTVQLLDIR